MKKTLIIGGGALLALCLLSACGSAADRGGVEQRPTGAEGQEIPDPTADLSFGQS